MSIIDHIVAANNTADGGEYLTPQCEFASMYPSLYQFVALHQYNGKERSPGRVIVYCEHGKGCVCLSDKHTGQVAFHVADSLFEALEGADRRLRDGKCDWRKDKRGQFRR